MARIARRIVLSLALSTAGALALGLGGCGSGSAQHNDILLDPSPVEAAESMRGVDFENQTSYTIDSNFRSMRSDFQRLMLLDRPSRLSPTPMR
jgi:hypothetical protein